MALPISTTQISVLRSTANAGDDGYPDSAPAWSTVTEHIPAHISSPGGTTVRDGTVQTRTSFSLAAEPCDLTHTDRVLDESTQTVYRVEWVQPRVGYGLEHVSAGLSTVEGFA